MLNWFMHSKMLFKQYKIEICSTIVLLDSHTKLKKLTPNSEFNGNVIFLHRVSWYIKCWCHFGENSIIILTNVIFHLNAWWINSMVMILTITFSVTPNIILQSSNVILQRSKFKFQNFAKRFNNDHTEIYNFEFVNDYNYQTITFAMINEFQSFRILQITWQCSPECN